METFVQFYEPNRREINTVLLRNTFSSVWNIIKERGEIIWINSYEDIFPKVEGIVYVSCSFNSELDYLEKWMKINPETKFIVGGPAIQYLNFSSDSHNFYPDKRQMYELLNIIPKENLWSLEIPKIKESKKISYIYSLAFGNKCYWGKCNFCDKSINEKDFNLNIKSIPVIRSFKNHVFLVKLALTQKDISNIFPNFTDDSSYSFYIRGDLTTLNVLENVQIKNNLTPLIGVEFPSDRMLKIMNKGTDVETLLKTLFVFLERGCTIHITTIGRWPNLIEKDVSDVENFLYKIEKFKKQIVCNNYVLANHKNENNTIKCSTKFNKVYYIHNLDQRQEDLNNQIDKMYKSFGFKHYENNFSFVLEEKNNAQKKIITKWNIKNLIGDKNMIKLNAFNLIELPIQKEGNTLEQTIKLFEFLKPFKKDLIKTWIYVKDIDKNYSDMSKGRDISFKEWNISEYFVSTGVQGWNLEENEFVRIKALVIKKEFSNIKRSFLSSNLMPHPSTYGSSFERGVRTYGEKCSFFIISGTASIDEKGNIVGNSLVEQLDKISVNINSLLIPENLTNKNIRYSIFYVKNKEDIETVKDYAIDVLKLKYFDVFHTSICRPDWLVEMECVATSSYLYNISSFKVKC